MRFLKDKEREHMLEKLGACYGFEWDMIGDVQSVEEASSKYQKKVDLRKRWFFFLKRKLAYPEAFSSFL